MPSWKHAAAAVLASGALAILILSSLEPSPPEPRPPLVATPAAAASLAGGGTPAPAASPSPAPGPSPAAGPPTRWSETGPIAAKRVPDSPAGSQPGTAPSVPDPEPRAVLPDDTAQAASVQTVLVLGADRKPVADALVSIRPGKGSLLARRRTSAQGTFQISAAECKGWNTQTRRVWVRHARWGRQGPFTLQARDATPTVQLAKENVGKLSGRILSTRGDVPGSPTIVVKTVFLRTRFTSNDFTRWDPRTGEYEIELVPSDRFTGASSGHFMFSSGYRIRVRAPGYCDSDDEYVSELGAGRKMDWKLEPECVVRGSLTLPVGYELDPANVDPKSASFEIEDELPAGPRSEARYLGLGERHSFELKGVHPGWHRIRASAGRMVGAWGTLQLQDGESVDSFTLHLDPPGWNVPLIEVTGKVVDREGAAIPECTIVTDGARAETLEDGSFVFRLTPGDHELAPAADGFAPPPRNPHVAVKEDTPVKPLKIVLESLDGQADD